MKGIMSGLAPMNMKKGGFPDLTGDGKVTQADILKGRGVEGFAEGGNPRFLSREGFLSLRDDPERLNVRDITDFIFDPTDPLDIAAAGAAATGLGIPAALGMKGLSTARKVKKGLGSLAKMIPATMIAREGIDILSDPIDYGKEILELVASAPDAGGVVGEIASSLAQYPKETAETIYQVVREESGYPIAEKANGGIMKLADGSDIGILPESAKTPTGKKKKAVVTVLDIMEEVAEKLPTKKAATAKPKAKPKPKKKTQAEKNREKMQAENQKKIQEAEKKRLAEARKAESERAAASTQRSQEAIDKADDVKKAAQTPKAADDVIPEGGNVDTRNIFQKINPYTSLNVLNPATKAKGTKTVAGLTAAASFMLGGKDSKEDQPLDASGDDGTFVTGDPVITSDGTKLPPVTDNSLAYYMKQDLAGKGFEFDPQTQTFTGDKKPSFFDYVKSLPAGYMEKVGDDPDYAKKMMAGFLNMMKPVEGYVPINPAVAFGEGYLGEETRQAEMLPADARLLEYFKKNPKALQDMLSLEKARSGVIGDYERKKADEQAEGIKRDLIAKNPNYTVDDYQNLNVFYKDPSTGQPIGPIDGTVLMSLQDRGLGFFANEFYLEPRK